MEAKTIKSGNGMTKYIATAALAVTLTGVGTNIAEANRLTPIPESSTTQLHTAIKKVHRPTNATELSLAHRSNTGSDIMEVLLLGENVLLQMYLWEKIKKKVSEYKRSPYYTYLLENKESTFLGFIGYIQGYHQYNFKNTPPTLSQDLREDYQSWINNNGQCPPEWLAYSSESPPPRITNFRKWSERYLYGPEGPYATYDPKRAAAHRDFELWYAMRSTSPNPKEDKHIRRLYNEHNRDLENEN